jgi:membrane dipeptidase
VFRTQAAFCQSVIDLHCDSVKFLSEGVDLLARNKAGHVDLPRLRAGGVGVQVFAAFVSASLPADRAFSTALALLDRIDAFAESSAYLVSARTAAECREAIASGKTGILRSVENGSAIEDSLANLEALSRRGVRILTLVHSRHTAWAASCTDYSVFSFGKPSGEPSFRGGGLSAFGKDVVAAMNSLGMIIDLSHAAEIAFWDVINLSKRPVIASHSCAYSLCAAARNLKDEQIKALAGAGGLVGVCFFPAFLSEAYRLAFESDCGDIFSEISFIEKKYTGSPALHAEYSRLDSRLASRLSRVRVPLSAVADHIDYIVSLGGEDCVALGSDFDGVFSLPEGMGGCDVYPAIEKELKKRGYSEKSLAKIFRENFLRVLAEHDGPAP